MSVRTRIEPSPSGSIHVGNALMASFNWYWARRHGGQFVLRIADTDKARVTREGIVSAMEDLRWLGLQWDEGPEVGGPHAPYFQSERIELYRAAAQRLLDAGAAYHCYCTPDELDARRKQALAEGRPPGYDRRCRTLSTDQVRAYEAEGRAPVVRLRMPDGNTRMTDVVRGEVVFDHAHVDDAVVLRSDGSPLYVLAAAYDDMAMGITHVIRGDDIFASTPKQVVMMRAWGASLPAYGHVPLLVGPGGEKLSKRHGATSVAEYRETGFLPDALLNYLAILDWSVGDGVTERFTTDELIQKWSPKGVTRNPSAFDPQKLLAMNAERIRSLPVDVWVEHAIPFLVRDGVLHEPLPDDERALLRKMAPPVQERMHRLDEAAGQLRFLFYEPEPDAKAKALLTPERAPLLQQAHDMLEKLEPWSVEAITEALMGWADASGLKRKDALQPLRAAVAGSLISPPLFESIEALGREVAVGRLRIAAGRARHAEAP